MKRAPLLHIASDNVTLRMTDGLENIQSIVYRKPFSVPYLPSLSFRSPSRVSIDGCDRGLVVTAEVPPPGYLFIIIIVVILLFIIGFVHYYVL